MNKIRECCICGATYHKDRRHCPYCGAYPLHGILLPKGGVMMRPHALSHVDKNGVSLMKAYGSFRMH